MGMPADESGHHARVVLCRLSGTTCSSRSDQELLSDSVLVSRHGCARLVGTAACSSDDLHRTRLKCADLQHRAAARLKSPNVNEMLARPAAILLVGVTLESAA